jgi:hypothetical protein
MFDGAPRSRQTAVADNDSESIVGAITLSFCALSYTIAGRSLYVRERTEAGGGVAYIYSSRGIECSMPRFQEKPRMKMTLLTGIALIVLGAAMLGYDHYSYTTKENVLQIGPITATADTTHTVSLPPLLGWLLIIGGAGALLVGAISKK